MVTRFVPPLGRQICGSDDVITVANATAAGQNGSPVHVVGAPTKTELSTQLSRPGRRFFSGQSDAGVAVAIVFAHNGHVVGERLKRRFRDRKIGESSGGGRGGGGRLPATVVSAERSRHVDALRRRLDDSEPSVNLFLLVFL